jgi:hypothetical protein
MVDLPLRCYLPVQVCSGFDALEYLRHPELPFGSEAFPVQSEAFDVVGMGYPGLKSYHCKGNQGHHHQRQA